MNQYSPLWNGIVDSSLWTEPDFVVKVFLTMIAKQDFDHVVRGDAFKIARWAVKTEKEVLEALKILAAPDRRKLEPQKFEGRRIEKVEEGWLLLNGKYYQDLMRAANQRWYKANKEREYRANRKKEKNRGQPLVGERAAVRAMENGDLARAEEIAGRPAGKPIVPPMELMEPIHKQDGEGDDEDFSGLAGS